jgi:mannose-6-phosphate isomerase-like protein (cupin superfamily)
MDPTGGVRKAVLTEALARLPQPKTDKWPLGVWDADAISHGTMSVSVFAPKTTDFQTPHTQDELYIVMSGTGVFVANDTQYTFVPGDVLFVPAGIEHRFVEFTTDFATWVVFYGPQGGEQSSEQAGP